MKQTASLLYCGKGRAVGQVKASGILASGVKQRSAQRQWPLFTIKTRERIGSNLLRWNLRIDYLIDKAAVGPVLKQPSDQIGQQITMSSNGGINSTLRCMGGADQSVQSGPHAVQALELKTPVIRGHMQDGRDGMGVMGGKLRIDPVSHGKQFADVGDIRDIGGCFSGKHWKPGQSIQLGLFDLAVPIGAFHETDCNLAIVALGQIVKVVNDATGAGPISLNDHTETVPSRQFGRCQNLLNYRQRQDQTVGLFSIDGQTNRSGFCRNRQRLQLWHQFRDDARSLGDLISWVQRR